MKQQGFFLKDEGGTSLTVQWLRLSTSTAEGTGSIPGRGTKIPHTCMLLDQKKVPNRDLMKKKSECTPSTSIMDE